MQTKRQSVIETVTSVTLGYLVAIGSQVVIFPLFGLVVSFGDNLLIGAFFTIVSIIRGYLIRRIFNSLEATVSSNNKRAKLASELERYNKWKRGEEGIEQPNPTGLGTLIDEVVKELRK